MSQHMVIFQNPDGDPGYNQFESIEEAVSFVETIRNDQGIDSIRIFELSEVKFDLKPYYKVELQALPAGSPSSSGSPLGSSAPSAPSAPAPSAPSAPAAPSAPTSPIGSDPSPAPTPSAPSPAPAPSAEPSSTSPFAAPSEPTPTYPAPSSAPTPPADQPQDDQPTRRGLFGR